MINFILSLCSMFMIIGLLLFIIGMFTKEKILNYGWRTIWGSIFIAIIIGFFM